METGNPNTIKIYKHALINQIKLEHCTLSIRVLPNGLSLFIQQDFDAKIWLAIQIESLESTSLIQKLHELWIQEDILQSEFKSCFVFIQNSNSIWVPEPFFDKNEIPGLLSKQIAFEPEHQDFLFDFHFKWNAYQVYPIAKVVKEFLDKNVQSKLEFRNDMYFEFNRSKKQLTIQKKVYYAQCNGQIDFWMMQGSALIFHKSIRDSENENEIEFKLLNVLKAYDFDFSDDIFYVLYKMEDSRFQVFYKYIKTIKVLEAVEILKKYTKNLKTLPNWVQLERLLE